MEVSPSRRFTNRWARTWGICLLELDPVLSIVSQFLVLSGMFGLLATGLVVWFREPGVA